MRLVYADVQRERGDLQEDEVQQMLDLPAELGNRASSGPFIFSSRSLGIRA